MPLFSYNIDYNYAPNCKYPATTFFFLLFGFSHRGKGVYYLNDLGKLKKSLLPKPSFWVDKPTLFWSAIFLIHGKKLGRLIYVRLTFSSFMHLFIQHSFLRLLLPVSRSLWGCLQLMICLIRLCWWLTVSMHCLLIWHISLKRKN